MRFKKLTSRRLTFYAVITIAIRLRYDYDTTMPQRIRLYDGSYRNYDSTAIRLRQDYDEKIDIGYPLATTSITS